MLKERIVTADVRFTSVIGSSAPTSIFFCTRITTFLTCSRPQTRHWRKIIVSLSIDSSPRQRTNEALVTRQGFRFLFDNIPETLHQRYKLSVNSTYLIRYVFILFEIATVKYDETLDGPAKSTDDGNSV